MQRQNIRLEQDKRHWRLLLCLHVKERWSCFSAPAIFLFQAFRAIGSTSLSTFPLSPFCVPILFKRTRKTCLLSFHTCIPSKPFVLQVQIRSASNEKKNMNRHELFFFAYLHQIKRYWYCSNFAIKKLNILNILVLH